MASLPIGSPDIGFDSADGHAQIVFAQQNEAFHVEVIAITLQLLFGISQ